MLRAPTLKSHTENSTSESCAVDGRTGQSSARLFEQLFLACIGIYGVTSYTVIQQTREIGIRMALGAQRKQVVSLILRQTLVVLAAGLAIGVPAVLATQRLISMQLYGLPPIDPVSISTASALLIGAAIVAGYLPARQATKVDPMEALRYE